MEEEEEVDGTHVTCVILPLGICSIECGQNDFPEACLSPSTEATQDSPVNQTLLLFVEEDVDECNRREGYGTGLLTRRFYRCRKGSSTSSCCCRVECSLVLVSIVLRPLSLPLDDAVLPLCRTLPPISLSSKDIPQRFSRL